jgi:cyanophycin synthetase
VNGRRIGVLAAPGDRRDEDILELARTAAPAFDFIIVREDDNLRGRRSGETGELVRRGLLAAGFPADRLSPEVYGEEEAVQRALENAQPGDLLVIFGDDLERVWQQIVSFGRPGGAAPVATTMPAPIFPPDERPLSSALAPAAHEPPSDGRRAGEHED